MNTVTSMKCACESCLCVVNIGEAIAQNGKYYCSHNCADGHPKGESCGHDGCNCH
ncbi:metallothionein [Merismopedia glauca CCAP 1448/3]|uniref:Metallothionein n=2 Tax=Merismopedia TaxID=53402 RepID=A0A2T1C4A6_9CYAN|nr:metallothionein [Merismopedia glauca]PSB03054.1 metallothionein [Merismopedia glauca CCAP 1448/3]